MVRSLESLVAIGVAVRARSGDAPAGHSVDNIELWDCCSGTSVLGSAAAEWGRG